MAASYPTSIKSNFSTKAHGHVIYASHLTDIEDEVVAIETALVAGLTVAHGGTGLTAAGTSGNVLTSDGSAWASTVPATPTATGLTQTFRGLSLQTGPDNDVALTTVGITGLAEWVTQDGTTVAEATVPVSSTALITAAGAAGLDTGSEAASTWYEIYRIRKSSDGTLNTMFHRAKDYFLDESFTTAVDNGWGLRTASTQERIAQSFDTDVSGLIEFVDFTFLKSNSPTGSFWATLEADSSGAPSGTPLATSDKVSAAAVNSSAQVIRFVFRSPYSVTAGTTYWIVFYGDYTPDQVSYLYDIATELGLVPCGGSDYHASGNPGEPQPGTVGPPMSTVEQLAKIKRSPAYRSASS